MKATKGARRRRSEAVQRELRSLRDEVQSGSRSSARIEGSVVPLGPGEKQEQRAAAFKQGGLGWRRDSGEVARQGSNEERGGHSAGYVMAADAATDDSYGDEEEKAPFSGAPVLSTSARLALAEKTLAEVTAQRDEALDKLDASRRENAKLAEELERARSYKALYAAAHQEHLGMKASLAASTQICMSQQKLIQMLQESSTPGALDPEHLVTVSGGGFPPPPPSPPPRPRDPRGVDAGRGRGGQSEPDKSAALAAAAIALAKGKGIGGAGGQGLNLGEHLEGAKLQARARKSGGVDSGVGGGVGGGGTLAAAAAAAAEGDLYDPYLRSPALFPEPDSASVNANARQGMSVRSAAISREAAVREGVGGGVGGGDGGGKGEGAVASKSHLLDDDLISHSSLRREFDDTFLNQPLRGEHRRGDHQQAQHHWSYGGGEGGGDVEGGSGEIGADAGALLVGHVRARGTRSHTRDKTRTKSGSLSSVSTVASTSKSNKALGTKEEHKARRGKSERGSAREATVASGGRGTAGSSPRPSAPRQARASQRLSSGTSVSVASSGGSARAGGSALGSGEPREGLSRRGSTGSSARLSSRKR